MQKPTAKPSRKKFLWLGTAALVVGGFFKFFSKPSKKETTKVKMLTQDGHLVEVDKALLASGKKITNEELHQWVKK